MEQAIVRGMIIRLALGLSSAGCGAGPSGGGATDEALGGAARPAQQIHVQRSAGALGGGARPGQAVGLVLDGRPAVQRADYGRGRVPGASLPMGATGEVEPIGGTGSGLTSDAPAPDTGAGGGPSTAPPTSSCVEQHREPTGMACLPDAFWIGLGTSGQGCASETTSQSLFLSQLTLDLPCTGGHRAADFLCCPTVATVPPALCEVRAIDLAGACYPTDVLQARASQDCAAGGSTSRVDASSVSFDAGSCASGSATAIHYVCCRSIG